jgi:hypothetical protein
VKRRRGTIFEIERRKKRGKKTESQKVWSFLLLELSNIEIEE